MEVEIIAGQYKNATMNPRCLPWAVHHNGQRSRILQWHQRPWHQWPWPQKAYTQRRSQHVYVCLVPFVNQSDRLAASSQQSPGLWRHPDDQSWRFADLEGWTKLATELEAASFHGIFIDDALGGIDTYRSLVSAVRTAAHWPVHEPLSLVSAMAAVTKSIGFSVTASTIHEEPYHLARRLSTVDHLSKGRLGWNVAIEQRNSASHNLGSERMTPEDAYARSEEYMRVVYKLVESSWRTDGVVFQRDKGVYAAPCLVREINHKGKYFDVPGPHMCHPSPQRTPIISQSPLILRPDVSGFAIDFAAKHAEVVVVSGLTPESVAGNVKDIRRIAKEKHGRDPQSIKILATATVVVGASEQEAKAKLTDYRQYGSLEGARVLFSDHTGIDVSKWGDEEDLRQVDSPVIK